MGTCVYVAVCDLCVRTFDTRLCGALSVPVTPIPIPVPVSVIPPPREEEEEEGMASESGRALREPRRDERSRPATAIPLDSHYGACNGVVCLSLSLSVCVMRYQILKVEHCQHRD